MVKHQGHILLAKLARVHATPMLLAANAENYRQIGRGVGAVTLGASATVAAAKGREKRGQAASVALYNDLMGRANPGDITLSEVQEIGAKYGVEFNKTAVGDLQQIYTEFLTALIPTDNTPLTYGPHPQLAPTSALQKN